MSVDRRDGDPAEKLKAPVMTLRIILLALASGIMVFAVVATVIRAGGEPQHADAMNLLTWMAIGAAPIALVASRLLPALIAGSARAQIAARRRDPSQGTIGAQAVLPELGDAGALYGVYQTKTIVGAALLEGAAFLGITAFLLEGTWIALGVGVGMAAVILTMFPSAPRAAEWIQQQLRRIDEEQASGR
jgi:hypothetical protein